MKKVLILGTMSFLVAQSVFSQDCSKLQPKDVTYLQSLSDPQNARCQDSNYEIILSHQNGGVVPLKSISVKKSDFKKNVTFVGNVLKVNGQKYDASQAAILDPACERNTDSGKVLYSGDIQPLGCKNQFEYMGIEREVDVNFVLRKYESMHAPAMKQAQASCESKVKTKITQKVEEYIKENGGKIISVKEKSSWTRLVKDQSALIKHKGYTVQVLIDTKIVDLELSYFLSDSSALNFTSPTHDAFGEVVPYTQRSGNVKLGVNPARFNWTSVALGEDILIKGHVAMLANPKTKKKVLEVDFSDTSCSEEITFNQDSSSASVVNNPTRVNPKADLESSPQAQVVPSGAFGQ